MNLDKIQNWSQNGPMGNDKQFDPVTVGLITAGVGVVNALGNQADQANEQAARDDYINKLMKIGGNIKSKANEFFDTAQDYAPGGKFYDEAVQSAMDTAFFAATKGQEITQAKGINMSNYGTNVMQDVVKEKYTTTFTDDYKQFADIGLKYAGIGSDLLGSWADIASSAGQVDYMGEASETSFLSDIGDVGTDVLSSWASGGFQGL